MARVRGRGKVNIILVVGMLLVLAGVCQAAATWQISGAVLTAGGSGVADVNVTGDNGGGSTVTGADGNYSITVPNNWSGTVSLSKNGWFITPGAKAYSNVRSNFSYENYIAYQPKISGYVRTADGFAISAAAVSASGMGTIFTNSSGYYEFTVDYGWSGIVRASKTGFNITPENISYNNVTSDQIEQNYGAFQPIISGVIVAYSTGLEGVTLSASNVGGLAVTNSGGYYSIPVPYGWSGIIVPAKDQYTFSPEEKIYDNVCGNCSSQNYIAKLPPVSISGYVRDSSGIGIAEVSITANNNGGSGRTDPEGNYLITVAYEWSGSVRAAKEGYTFTPAVINYSKVIINQVDRNYLGTKLYSGGDGSAENPFEIASTADWRQMMNTSSHWNCHFKLTADLDFNGETLTPVGNYTNRFTKTFEGGNHVVRNIVINFEDTWVGLFGYVDGGVIKNLGVEGIDVTGTGGLVSELYQGTIDSCYTTGMVHGIYMFSGGGLVGESNLSKISNSYSTATVSGTFSLGGLVGYNFGSQIISSYATGNVEGNDHFTYGGGLVGTSIYGKILSCYAAGDVKGRDYNGGLVGTNTSGEIINCYALGDVNGEYFLGGLCGRNSGGNIISSFSKGAVTGITRIGGLLGDNNFGALTNCYSRSPVSGRSYVGGLLGADKQGTVLNCFAAGTFSSTGSYSGGMVGYTESSTLESCYWDTTISGWTSSAGGTGKTTAEMKMPATFSGWDFVNSWHIFEGSDYPHLTWQLKDGDLLWPYGVGMEDLAYFTGRWLEEGEAGGSADVNKDGVVNMDDYKVVAENWMAN